MADKFMAKTFITDATALDNTQTDGRGVNSMAKQVEDYLTSLNSGGASADLSGAPGARQISISSCKLKGDRVFTIVVAEDQYSGS